MANSGGLPSHPTASNANPSAFLAGIPDDIILSVTPFLRERAIVSLLESNFPLSNRCILYLGERDFGFGIRLAHIAANLNCRIALRRLHGAGYNMKKGDREGFTPLHLIAMPLRRPYPKKGLFSEEDSDDTNLGIPSGYTSELEGDNWPLTPMELEYLHFLKHGPPSPSPEPPSGPDVDREACKTIYAICLNSHTLRAEGRETAEVQLPHSFKIAHPLNLETQIRDPLAAEFHLEIPQETALSVAVRNYRWMVVKQLLIEGTYIKLREIQETMPHWKWFLRQLREWDRFPELKHRKKGWYCMKKSTETNDVPPWAHWKKRHAQPTFH